MILINQHVCTFISVLETLINTAITAILGSAPKSPAVSNQQRSKSFIISSLDLLLYF